MSGIASSGNSMSTTGPITRATRPVAGPLVWSTVASTVVAVILASLRWAGGSSGGESVVCSGRQGVGTGDDLADLLGDVRLTGLVGQSGVRADQVLGVVRRRVHRALPGRELGGRRVEQDGVDPLLHVARQERVQHGLGRG